jgi:hypothetical protein
MTISNLFSKLTADPWRAKVGFSADMESANQRIFAAKDGEQVERVLREWLQKYQPCLFGRLAAKLDKLSFCVLTEADLTASDEHIRDKIQAERSHWTRAGFEGNKSGFVILAVSPTLANSIPDVTMKQLALRLCALYLLIDDIQSDRIYLDEIFLEKPGSQRTTWKWLVGVNVFSASGDRRWWQDHRIPGGLGFSMNSVGHMVKSSNLEYAMREMDSLLEGTAQPPVTAKVDSLEKALEFAMRTIWLASDAISGKATELLPRPTDDSELPLKCPVELPSFLANKNYCEYRGFYHTDVTVPSDYFLEAVERPAHIKAQSLDFTYLFNDQLENPAHQEMGKGRKIRGVMPDKSVRESPISKWAPETLALDDVPRLRTLLGVSEIRTTPSRAATDTQLIGKKKPRRSRTPRKPQP